MSRRPDILDEFTAEHRAVEELLTRIEAGLGAGSATPEAPGAPEEPDGAGTADTPGSTGAAGPAGTAEASAELDEAAGLLTDLLFSHCAAEEEHLFPVVQHDVPDGGALVFRCIHDHLAIGQYLSDLQGLPPGDPTAGTLLQGLAELLRRHLATEEEQLYAAARKALPADTRAALAERLRTTRAEIAEAGP
ncbi:hemerythrin domain-containing protein [Kitasatospora sp. NBC_00458]|uniref:hemerythrin domain-containing protein n=1 Tax=Kitasatospora sp. NBC_00458 TaxID=2903568 RepID=UPI002E18087D